MIAKIDIDHSKCTVPMDCKKCLQICVPAVFHVRESQQLRGIELDKTQPGAFVLEAVYRDKCTGCDDCVRVCPVDAITISWPMEVKS